jgi:hypothetical protein
VKTAAPTLDNDGNALVAGALYFNSGAVTLDDKGMWVYDGGAWIAASAASQAIMVEYEYTATAGQTTFSGADDNALTLSYTAGSIIVTLNGVVLDASDYTASNGNSVVLAVGASAGDELNVRAFSTFDIANHYTQAQVDAGFVSKDSPTGAALMPVGTTAQRPASPAAGMFRLNTTTTEPEWYDTVKSEWVAFRTEPDRLFSADFLVIAGGGGGGGHGGGGGAGGYRTSAGTSGGGASAESSLTISSATNYTVTVGAGGAGGVTGSSPLGVNGSNSVFSTITSTGGGGGGSNPAAGLSGGSGGGGNGMGIFAGAGGSGTANQGFAGGSGQDASSPQSSGGGGGASQAGANATSGVGGNGGAGVASSITGSSVTRAGGGGGSFRGGSGTNGTGGAGGGGNGNNAATAGSGTANTGGGGGGGGFNGSDVAQNGGAGGSGVVIVKYPDTLTISNPGGGLTSSTASAGGFKVTTFTAGTGTIQFNL